MLNEQEQAALGKLKELVADGKPNAIFTVGKEIDLAKWSQLPAIPNKDTWYQDFRNVEGLQFVLWRELETKVQNMWQQWDETIRAMIALAEAFASEPEEEVAKELTLSEEDAYTKKVEAFAAQQPESSTTSSTKEFLADPWGIGQ